MVPGTMLQRVAAVGKRALQRYRSCVRYVLQPLDMFNIELVEKFFVRQHLFGCQPNEIIHPKDFERTCESR